MTTGKRRRSGKSGPLTYVCTGLIAGLALKVFAIDLLHVSGASMEPSIHSGSVVLVNKLAYGLVRPWGSGLLAQWGEPRAGEVVIFLHDDRTIIKRVAATADTRLEYSSDNVYSMSVGGASIPLSEEQFARLHTISSVPAGTVLVIGDNYTDSVDSREYGFVSVKSILGRVICRQELQRE